MKAIYDSIGSNYAVKRQTDPKIAEQIFKQLEGARSILNIGAGAGSYEPQGANLTALEPSQKMIDQRPQEAQPVIQGVAESLPFEDNHFSHTMTVLSMHHWTNRSKAFQEINRVTSEKFIALSWNPECDPFWLTRDYFPEIIETDRDNFPDLNEMSENFANVKMHPILIPDDCRDGFLAAFWKRPEAYLNQVVRNSISTFSKLKNIESGLTNLRSDIESGEWQRRNKEILNLSSLDAGYVLITGEIADNKNISLRH